MSERHKVAIATLDAVDKLVSEMRLYVSQRKRAELSDDAAVFFSDAWNALSEADLPRDVATRARSTFGALLSLHKETLLSESARRARVRKESRVFVGKSLLSGSGVVLAFVLALKGAPDRACLAFIASLYVWGFKKPLVAALNAWRKFIPK